MEKTWPRRDSWNPESKQRGDSIASRLIILRAETASSLKGWRWSHSQESPPFRGGPGYSQMTMARGPPVMSKEGPVGLALLAWSMSHLRLLIMNKPLPLKTRRRKDLSRGGRRSRKTPSASLMRVYHREMLTTRLLEVLALLSMALNSRIKAKSNRREGK